MTSPTISRAAAPVQQKTEAPSKKKSGRYNTGNFIPKDHMPHEIKTEEKIEKIVIPVDNTLLKEVLDTIFKIFPQKSDMDISTLAEKGELSNYIKRRLNKIIQLKNLFKKNLEENNTLKETNSKLQKENNELKDIIEQIKTGISEYNNTYQLIDVENREEVVNQIIANLECADKALCKIAEFLSIEVVKIISESILNPEPEIPQASINMTEAILLEEYTAETAKSDANSNEAIVVPEKITPLISDPKVTIKDMLTSLQIEGKRIKESFDSLRNEVNDQINRINSVRIDITKKNEISIDLPGKCKQIFKDLSLYKKKLDKEIILISEYINEKYMSNLHQPTLVELGKTHSNYSLDKISTHISLHRFEIDQHITELQILLIKFFELTDIYLDMKYVLLTNKIRSEQKIFSLTDFEMKCNELWNEEENDNNIFNIQPFFQVSSLNPTIFNEIVYSTIIKYFHNILVGTQSYHNDNTITRKGFGPKIELSELVPFYNNAKLSLKFSEIKWNSIKSYLSKIKINLEEKVAKANAKAQLDNSHIQSFGHSLEMSEDEIKIGLQRSAEKHLKNTQELNKLLYNIDKFETEVITAKKNYNRTHDAIVRGQGVYDWESLYHKFGKADKDLEENIFNSKTLKLEDKKELEDKKA